MEQMIDFPTRGERTLDLIFTNHASLVDVCEGLPALSDHDVVFLDMYAKAQRQKPVRRKIYLWKRVDLESLRSDAVLCTNNFVHRYSSNTPVEILAISLQQELEQLMENMCPRSLLQHVSTNLGSTQTPKEFVGEKHVHSGRLGTQTNVETGFASIQKIEEICSADLSSKL